MSSTPTNPRSFELVRRGYSPPQVEETFAALVRDLTTLREQRDAIARQFAELENRFGELTAEFETQRPTYRGVSERVGRILELAEDEATELRTTTQVEIERDRRLAQQEIDRLREKAEAYAAEVRGRADAEADELLTRARREAEELRDSADRHAAALREEAETVFEHNRARAAQAAADFEITLSHRREQAERDYSARMAAVEAQLLANERRSDQLQAEANELKATSEAKAGELLDSAQRRADELVREATDRAARLREDSERELATMAQRRDSINLQLTNVRQMLATLTGAPPPADPIAAVGEPDRLDNEPTVIQPVAEEAEPEDATDEEQGELSHRTA